MTALDNTDHPLKAETVSKGVWKPLLNMEYSNPRQVDLDGRMLNPIGQEDSKQAQCPFVSWTRRTRGVELAKLRAKRDKLSLG